jgi:hypothetical protein
MAAHVYQPLFNGRERFYALLNEQKKRMSRELLDGSFFYGCSGGENF